MFQREVGERLVAQPGSRDYGILSVLMQSWFTIERVIKVPPQAFTPPPKVDSVVLKFSPLEIPAVNVTDESAYRKIVKGAFAQRRKTLRNSLMGSGWNPAVLDDAFEKTEIDPKRRGETLGLKEFALLAETLSNISPE